MIQAISSLARLVVAALVAVAPTPGLADSPVDDDPAQRGRRWIRTYTDRDGLPQGSAEAMAIDRHGRLWAGTRGGAARFDGRAWTTVDLPSAEKSTWVRAVATTADGAVWLGTESGGVHVLAIDGTWTSSRLPASLGDQLVAFAVLGDGERQQVWCATSRGLAFFDDGWREIPLPLDGAPILAIEAIDGELLIGTEGGGLVRGLPDAWRRVGRADGLVDANVQAIGATTDADGSRRLHLATGTDLVSVDGDRFVVDPRPGLRPGSITTMVEIPLARGGSELWVGTIGDGLFRPTAERWIPVDPDGVLPSQFILSLIAVPEQRHVLVGTLHGIAAVRLDGWIALDDRSGLPHRSVFSLLDGSDGFWFGTSDGGAARYADRSFTPLSVEHGLPHTSVWAMLETTTDDGTRSLWLGTENGLFRRRGGAVRVFDRDDGLPHVAIVAIENVPTRGQLWVGTFGGGVAAFDHASEAWSVPDHRLADGRVEALLAVPNPSLGIDDLWVATDRGLARLQGDTWTNLPIEPLPDPVARSLHRTTLDGVERLLVGTGSGLAWTDPHALQPTWEQLAPDVADRLPDDVIYRIEEDLQGRLYLCTNRGVARLTPTGEGFAVESFGIEDGLPAYECSFGGSTRDRHGRIWVGTSAGAAVFDPTTELAVPPPATLRLEAAVSGVSGRRLADGDVLRHDERNLVFRYDLESLFDKRAVRFSTRLLDFEAQPSEWSASTSRELIGLPTGTLRFEVRARDHLGREIGPVTLGFRRRPPLFQTWWARLGYAALAITLVLGAFRWRVRGLHRRIVELEAEVREAQAEARRHRHADRRGSSGGHHPIAEDPRPIRPSPTSPTIRQPIADDQPTVRETPRSRPDGDAEDG